MSQSNEPQKLDSVISALYAIAGQIQNFADKICANGILLETADSYEAEKIKLKIQSLQFQIQKLRQALGKVRSHLNRQRQITKERNRK